VKISDKISGIRIGNSVQNPLHTSGDDIRIDWGYFYLSAEGASVGTSSVLELGRDIKQVYVSGKMCEGKSALVTFAYDDIESIEYFGKKLKSYWNKDGKTILQAISEAARIMMRLSANAMNFQKSLLLMPQTLVEKSMQTFLPLLGVRLWQHTSLCLMRMVKYFSFPRNAGQMAVLQQLM
jgi:hypothetical protein